MARANLIVGDDLRHAFQKANEGTEKVRWLKARVNDVTMQFISSSAGSDNLEKDVLEIRDKAMDTDACFILVCLDTNVTPRKWVLVAHVPTTCLVKHRMLYASGRDDLKTALGTGSFLGEVHCTDKEDLSVESLLRPVKRNQQTDLPFSELEMMKKEEHAASAKATSVAEKGMASVQFKCTQPLISGIKDLLSHKINWIACKITDAEEIEIENAENVGSEITGNGSRLHTSEPRFYICVRKAKAASIGEIRYLIFHCPESASIRKRMVYSTAKAALQEQALQIGLEIDKLLETRDQSDLDDLFKNAETVDDSAGKIVHQSMDKPKGPPRRTRGGR